MGKAHGLKHKKKNKKKKPQKQKKKKNKKTKKKKETTHNTHQKKRKKKNKRRGALPTKFTRATQIYMNTNPTFQKEKRTILTSTIGTYATFLGLARGKKSTGIVL